MKIKCNNVGAGFPRPIALITERGGENPPLRQVMWLRLIFKGHKPTAKLKAPLTRRKDRVVMIEKGIVMHGKTFVKKLLFVFVMLSLIGYFACQTYAQ